MGEAEKQKQAQINQRVNASKLKTCSKCGLDKPLDDFSRIANSNKRRTVCNGCTANFNVTCAGCHTKRKETLMKIYAVREEGQIRHKGKGLYFCNQKCHDRAWGIERDSEGYSCG